MKRSKKIMLLCHCILNCNSKVEGCSTYCGAMPEITKVLIDSGIGMVQLPCPELTMYGIKRWGHVKNQFDTPYYRKHCRILFQPYIEQLEDYIKNGYEVVGFLGIDGSPSCGMNKTCIGKWGGEFSENPDLAAVLNTAEIIEAKGIFIEEAEALLEKHNINMPFIGIDEAKMADSIEIINNLIRGLS